MKASWLTFLPESIRVQIQGRHYLRNVLCNAGWLFADNVIRMGINFFIVIWIARYLGPAQYGLFSYASAFAALFSSFALLGLDDIVIRNIVRDPACKDETLGTCFLLKVAGGGVTFAALVAGIVLVRPDDRSTQWLVAVIGAGTLFQAFTTIEHWFYSQVQSKYLVWAKCSVFLCCSVLKAVLVLVEASLMAFAWVALLEIAAGSAALLVVYRAQGNLPGRWHSSFATARRLLTDSWPLLFSSVVMMVYLRIDQVMLGEMLGNEEVGVYSAAVRLAEVWFFLPQIIFASVLPSIVEAKGISDEVFYRRLQTLYNVMALVNYTVAIPVTLFANWLVVTMFGSEYAGAGPMLAVLIWANLFSSFELARSSFLTTMNWTRINFVTISLGAVMNVALNYLLIPRYGGMGAAVASCIAYWFAAHGACFVFRPLLKTGFMLTRALVYPKVW